MASTIKYYIDTGKRKIDLETAKPELTVAEMLTAAKLSPEEVVLVGPAPSKTVHDDPKQVVKISDQAVFTTQPRKGRGEKDITIKVNGEEIKTSKSEMTMEEILKAAGKDASVNVQDLTSYFLEHLESGVKYDNLQDLVPLIDGDQFLAVHRGKTPVA